MIELTPENIVAVTDLLHKLGWTNKGIQSLEPAGEGNMNRTLRAYLEDGSSIILKQSVDHVAQYPDIAAPIERVAVEAAFYAAIASHPHLAASSPILIGYDSRHHLLSMQDLGEGADFTDHYVGSDFEGRLPAATLRHVLVWLSGLHAIAPPEDFPTNAAMRTLNHAHIFEIPLLPATHETLTPVLGTKTMQLAHDIINRDSLNTSAQALGDLYLGRVHTAAKGSLLHGDFYPASWLRSGTAAACIIDPEFAFVGPAEFDVGVFQAHLIFCGYSSMDAAATLKYYTPPPGFDTVLVDRFAGMEIIRRILGVAQLPLVANDDTKAEWLSIATELLAAD